jgi:hypothetical protein
MKAIYVSDEGDDERNDGMTPDTPVRTYQRARELMNVERDRVYLRRGDAWEYTDFFGPPDAVVEHRAFHHGRWRSFSDTPDILIESIPFNFNGFFLKARPRWISKLFGWLCHPWTFQPRFDLEEMKIDRVNVEVHAELRYDQLDAAPKSLKKAMSNLAKEIHKHRDWIEDQERR